MTAEMVGERFPLLTWLREGQFIGTANLLCFHADWPPPQTGDLPKSRQKFHLHCKNITQKARAQRITPHYPSYPPPQKKAVARDTGNPPTIPIRRETGDTTALESSYSIEQLNNLRWAREVKSLGLAFLSIRWLTTEQGPNSQCSSWGSSERCSVRRSYLSHAFRCVNTLKRFCSFPALGPFLFPISPARISWRKTY